jgi:hypothetical protein
LQGLQQRHKSSGLILILLKFLCNTARPIRSPGVPISTACPYTATPALPSRQLDPLDKHDAGLARLGERRPLDEIRLSPDTGRPVFGTVRI